MTCMYAAASRCETSRFPPASTEAHFRAQWWRHVARLVLAWAERRRQRDALAELDARLLDDIGVSSDDVQAEARKPFWRA